MTLRHASLATAAAVGMLVATSTPAGATETFTAPAYRDPDCEVYFPGYGNSYQGLTADVIGEVVGLPLSLPAAPAAQTMVVVEMGQSVDQSIVTGFLNACGMTVTPWTDVLWPGDATPALGGEATLDLTVVAGILPSNTTLKTATIFDGVDFKTALTNAGNACGLDGTDWTTWSRSQLDTPTGGCIVSMSYSVFEESLRDILSIEGLTTSAAQDAWIADVEAILASLASSGVITVVSSGDEGSGGCQPLSRGKRNTMAPQWPSTSTQVLSVGGTMWVESTWLSRPMTTTDSYVPGTTMMPAPWRSWNLGSDCDWDSSVTPAVEWPAVGTTGGVSIFAPLPDYQTAAASVVGLTSGRLSPDLAALAGWPQWLTPLPAGGGINLMSGTSAAAPLVAVGLAHVNAALTSRGLSPLDNSGGPLDVHNVIYDPDFSSVFNDVTSGTNNIWSSDLWSGADPITTTTLLNTQVPGFLDGSNLPTANGAGTITGYSAGVGFDLTTGLGVPNFSRLASLLISAQTPAPGGPPPILQQLPAPDSGSCDLVITTYDWGGSSAGGWSKSWAQWANDGNGGPVCTRTLIYSSALRHWIVQR